ncbi:hypothetical protein K491DRAFT_757665 [Lophiostoma macrostomum CBS 122681]|uniref:Uncharacterized protein n=1 Tax=Lophiostoma macrostomum CBS 122681 TaxID=1314788 RepID=A0A6A6T8N8_9PLEO|nr:hypothetical protein K491DRAFT_757665 [Lophiostoma macrostomum CBS 122681]
MSHVPSDQLQSGLFRLPRELRDEIYAHYLLEEDGYFYDFESRRMLRNSDTVSNELKANEPTSKELVPRSSALSLTCRRAADELRWVALRTDSVTFIPGYSEHYEGEYKGIKSRAGRFECLLKYVQVTKMDIMVYAKKLLTPEILGEIETRYPGLSKHFRAPLTAASMEEQGSFDTQWFLPNLFNNDEFGLALSIDFHDALQFALELIRGHDHFDQLAKKALEPLPPKTLQHVNMDNRRHRNLFSATSLSTILDWHPAPWAIPSDTELSSIEQLLTEPKPKAECIVLADTFQYTERDLDFSRGFEGVRWHFSACAVTLGFLKLYPPQKLRRIKIREDCKSVSYPERHFQALGFYMKENPSLRIEVHIGPWMNMLPVGWEGIMDRRNVNGSISGDCALLVFATWLGELIKLPSHGLPADRVLVILEGQCSMSLELWDKMKQAAGLQEAMIRLSHEQGLELPHYQADPQAQARRTAQYFRLPCHLPDAFSRWSKTSSKGGP